MKRGAALLGTAILVALPPAAGASESVEPLRASSLQTLCRAYLVDPAGPQGRRCMRYVQGFLDGVLAGDPRPSPDEADARRTWVERAARTRLGPRFSEFESQATRAYCPGDPPPVQRFIEQLLARLEAHAPDESMTAREVLWRTLEARYRCEDRSSRHASQ